MGHRERRHRRGPGHRRENLTTQFKTASQQGTGPDIVVWAHDAVADFVQNSAIDPVTMPDTSMFDPLAVKGMTYQGQLYGVPYSIENIALIRNTDLAPECPATMEDLVSTGQQLVKDKKATNIMALQVGQKGDAYHIYPLFTSGGGSFFGTTATGDPDPDQRDRRLRRNRSRPARSSPTWARRASARSSAPSTTRTPSRCSPAARPPFLVSGPWAIADIKKAKVNYDVCAIPAFADGKPASPFIGVNGFYLASKGKNKTLAQEFLTSVVPTADFQVGPVRGRPAPPGADRGRRPRSAADDPNIPKFADAGARRHDPARDPGRWARSGARSASPRPPSSAAPTRRRPSRPPPRRSATGSPTSSRRSARGGRAIREGRSGRLRRTAGRPGFTAPARAVRGDGGGAIR